MFYILFSSLFYFFFLFCTFTPGQCLQTVIEDNQAALNAFLQNSELLNSLFKTLNLLETASSDDFQTLLLRVTISGIDIYIYILYIYIYYIYFIYILIYIQ